MMTVTHRLIAAALAAPLCAMLAWLTIVTAVERTGGRAFAGDFPRNLAEAAATGRADDVVRRLGYGEDPYRVYDVRPEIISPSILKASLLEAALWSRQVQMVDMLSREGVLYSADQRHDLACLAADISLGDVVDYLSPGTAPACTPGDAVKRVMARTPAN